MFNVKLPRPGAAFCEAEEPRFEAVPALGAWVRDTFLSAESDLINTDHDHLVDANIGFVWTNVANSKNGQAIIGTAQLGRPTGQPWSRGRSEQQLREWFGQIPDFLITLDARFLFECSDAEACALVEHELYHCAQATDEFGSDRFDDDGNPIWRMRGHDIEEFAGVIERYGAGATHSRQIKEAFEVGPTISPVAIRVACGVCLKVA